MGDLRIPRYLLDERKVNIDINGRNVFGRTVLATAVRHNKNPVFVEYLVKEKHANVSIADNKGRTPLLDAINDENVAMIKYLIENGANIDCKDEDGKTPVQLTKDPKIVKYFEKIAQKRQRRSVYQISATPVLYRDRVKSMRLGSESVKLIDGDSGLSNDHWRSVGLDNLLVLLDVCLTYAMGWNRNKRRWNEIDQVAHTFDFDALNMRL